MSSTETEVAPKSLGYPKIETLFERDPETFRVTEHWRLDEFSLITRWYVTEKIDGMNIRVFFIGDKVWIAGRTDNANVPPALTQHLLQALPPDKVAAAFDDDSDVVLFGEGYGEKIQNGGSYRRGINFRLFDVAVYGETGRVWWLNWPDVEDVARKLDVQTVPVLGEGIHLSEAIDLHSGPSVVDIEDEGPGRDREGIVARTHPLLFDRRGRRVMWKLKEVDFKEGKR